MKKKRSMCFGGGSLLFCMTVLVLIEPHHEKTRFCICKNKGAEQLYSNCTADQCLCFRYTNCTIPLLSKSKISSLYLSSVTVVTGLCPTWSKIHRPVFSITAHLILLQ